MAINIVFNIGGENFSYRTATYRTEKNTSTMVRTRSTTSHNFIYRERAGRGWGRSPPPPTGERLRFTQGIYNQLYQVTSK